MGHALLAYDWWQDGVGDLVRVAASVTAGGVIWNKALAPLLFRPVGRALAHGARSEAVGAIEELVSPHIEELTRGQQAIERRLGILVDYLADRHGLDLDAAEAEALDDDQQAR